MTRADARRMFAARRPVELRRRRHTSARKPQTCHPWSGRAWRHSSVGDTVAAKDFAKLVEGATRLAEKVVELLLKRKEKRDQAQCAGRAAHRVHREFRATYQGSLETLVWIGNNTLEYIDAWARAQRFAQGLGPTMSATPLAASLRWSADVSVARLVSDRQTAGA